MVTVAQMAGFDCVIDARSPAEFGIDRIPGAINCPSLDNEQRRIVGTLYKQTGAFEARRVGGAMVADNIGRYLREQFADKPHGWRPLIYCWRGGMRSGSMVTWFRLVGWDAQQLQGGYKAWRRYVIDFLEERCPAIPFRVLIGATGSAKTRVLQAMRARGCQVLDLEALAEHKGSLLGGTPGVPQPSQTAFETQIAHLLEQFDLTQPVYVEGESRRIGRLTVPVPLIERMRESPCVEINATREARLSYLLRDYHYLGDDPESLLQQLGKMKEQRGAEVVTRWQEWALQKQLTPLFDELMALHYDPLYARSQSKNYTAWDARQSLSTDDLSPQGIEELAMRVMALPSVV
jgi:tRNA 2-selenouridine synthase